MIESVSAVLLNWRRPYHLEEIVTHLRTFEQIKDITIVCNGPFPNEEWIHAATLVYPQQNLCTLGRFIGAARVECDAVFIQDDDLLVHNIPQLVAEYDGTRIIANLADDANGRTGSRHWQFWQRDPKPYVELGFGAIFPKQFAIDYLAMKWTDDEELRRRKSDKAFTCLFPWKAVRAGPDDLARLTHDGKESGRDENALFKRQDHLALTEKAVVSALAYKNTITGTRE